MTPRHHPLLARLLAVVIAAGSALVAVAGSPPAAQAAPAGTFRNPLSPAADPYITHHGGRYYAVETGGDNTIRMRTASSLGNLLAAPAAVIWTESDPARNRDIWAPVVVSLADRWYVYWTGDNGDIGNHRMQVLESDATISQGATPAGPYHYKAQLNDPSSGYFGIDGVPFVHNGALWFVWASGYCCGFDRLRLAPMANPWTLTGSSYELPVDICDAVAEAPATLHRNGRTFLTYSVCDTGRPGYQVKMLSIGDGADPMQGGNWRNHGTVFASNPAAGAWSVGSNGFFTSPDGTEDWIVYQAKNTAAAGDNTYAGRDTRAQRFGWNADGTPNFGAPVAKGADLALPAGDPGPAPRVVNDTDTAGGTGAATGPIRGPGGASKCIDVSGDDVGVNGAAVQIWDCLGVRDQSWTLPGDGTVRTLGKCMDVEGYGTANRSRVHLWDCHGGANQVWQPQPGGALRNPVSGRCLDLDAGNTTNGVQLQLWDCNGQWPQAWQLPTGSTGSGVTYSAGWTAGTGCGVQCYHGDDHYTDQSGATATITFTGNRIALLGVRDVGNGIAAVSVDNGPETTVDQYGPVRDGERVLWVSPALAYGPHTLRIRNTGSRNPASQATFIGFDRAEAFQ